RGRSAGLPRRPRLRRPRARAAGPRRHGARPRHRQAGRPRPALTRHRGLATTPDEGSPASAAPSPVDQLTRTAATYRRRTETASVSAVLARPQPTAIPTGVGWESLASVTG